MRDSDFKKYYWIVEVNAKKYANTWREDYDDLKSFLNAELWITYLKYDKDKGGLESFLNITLQRRLLDYLKLKANEFHRSLEFFSSLREVGEDGEETIPDFEDPDVNIELEVTEGIKTDEDKRKLVNALLENTDSLTTAIAREYLEDENATPTAIGRELGVHHQTVRRKLDALAHKYYASYDDSIYDYLAV